jgi:hypothetical protein
MRKKTILLISVCLAVLLGGAVAVYLYFGQPKTPYPIDLVYLWVDGSDENWLKKKEYWRKKDDPHWLYATSTARWRDRDELRHSLRSVEMYLPWVRQIFIVTDHQVPSWLNTNHPKIRIVDHTEIFPPDALPVFNSNAIESRLSYIPGLAEHFIYLNDDVFVNAPLTPDFFFDADGKPISYIDRKWTKIYRKIIKKNPNDRWSRMVMNPAVIVEKKTGKKIPLMVGTHTSSAYLKSDYQKAQDLFEEEMRPTVYSKFRSPDDLTRGLVGLYAYTQGHVTSKDSLDVDPKFSCSPSGLLVMLNMEDLRNLTPCLFCLNDTQDLPDEYNWAHTNYLKKRFPKKSSFEK